MITIHKVVASGLNSNKYNWNHLKCPTRLYHFYCFIYINISPWAIKCYWTHGNVPTVRTGLLQILRNLDQLTLFWNSTWLFWQKRNPTKLLLKLFTRFNIIITLETCLNSAWIGVTMFQNYFIIIEQQGEMSTFVFIFLLNFKHHYLNDIIVIHISYLYVTEGLFGKTVIFPG